MGHWIDTGQDWRPKGTHKPMPLTMRRNLPLWQKKNIIRIILSLVTHFGWDLEQFDVKNLLLHGDLEEEVYMEILHGFESHNGKNKCVGWKGLCMASNNLPEVVWKIYSSHDVLGIQTESRLSYAIYKTFP